MDVAQVAHRWFDEIRAGDMRAAWSVMSDNFRTCLAQATMTSMHEDGRPVDDLLARFSRAGIETSDEAAEFLRSAREGLLSTLAPDIVQADVAPASRPRPLSPGLELVPLVVVADARDRGDGPAIPPGGVVRAVRVLVEDGRAVAGLDYLMAPGWPPTVAYSPPTDE